MSEPTLKIVTLLVLCVGLLGCSAPTQSTSPPQPSPTASSTPAPTLAPTVQATPSPMAEGAGNADVEFVRVVQTAVDTYTFYVTVRHPDTGWDDYADGWDVVLPDGAVLKPKPDDPFTRLLLHPHENEQPFTRSQSNIQIPADITQVTVRAHDLVDGFGGQEVVVDLTAVAGTNYTIER